MLWYRAYLIDLKFTGITVHQQYGLSKIIWISKVYLNHVTVINEFQFKKKSVD